MEIIDGLHQITGLIGNVYLLVGSDLVLIDAGAPWGAARVLRCIEHLGCKPEDLKHILITHGDFDHVGGLADLIAATGAKAYAHPLEAEAIAAGQPPRRVMHGWRRLLSMGLKVYARAKAAPIAQTLNDGDIVPVLSGLRVIHTPGHTPGHMCYFEPKRRILFSGDTLVTEGGRLRGAHSLFTPDMTQATAAVKRLALLEPDIVCSGHGPALRGTAEPLRKLAAKLNTDR
jgi:glyoxylase-like metal-dependent hydrolase (beta-lactamase superfamily II)